MRSGTMKERFLLLVLGFVTIVPLLAHFDGVEANTGDGTISETGSPTGTADARHYGGFTAEEVAKLEAGMENLQYQSDVSRLMGLIINSLYSNKEVFLRELISNASDALDKIRYISLTKPEALESGSTLDIKIWVDTDTNTINIRDTGIGMTREELKQNLGSIASSGTKRFVDSISKDGGDSTSLIGQFGVGFYSVFLVAEEVIVTTKSNDDEQYVWRSGADANYSIAKDPRGNTLGRGTQLSIKLKEEALEFMDQETLTGLIEHYSEFINFPISLEVTTEEEEEVELSSTEITALEEARAAAKAEKAAKKAAEADDDEDENVVEDEEEEEETPTSKKIKVTKKSWKVVNSAKPIWTRSKSDITEEDYVEFYKSLANTDEEPLTHIHFTAEGEIDFRSILYIPKKAPADFLQSLTAKMKAIKLYVRRVFITDDFDDILPIYLQFIKGMVDSDNLPLNVSREMLQQHKMLKTIKKKLTRKVLEMIQKMEDDEETYNKFWAEYGTAMKLGLTEDTANRTKLAKLMRFKTSKSNGEWRSLEKYVEGMKKSQKNIYYLAGESVEQIEKSPYLEILLKKGFECLYLSEPVDEYAINTLPEFEGKKLVNVGKDGSLFDEEEDKADLEEEYSELLSFLKSELSSYIEKAVISKRLYTSPVTLVSSSYGMTPNMERIMKAQTLAQDPTAQFKSTNKKRLEINPRHPLIKEMKARVELDKEDPVVIDMAMLLYETAALGSGYSLDGDSSDFVNRVHRQMMKSLNVDPDAPIDKDEALENPAPEEVATEEDVEEEVEVKAKADRHSSDEEKDEL